MDKKQPIDKRLEAAVAIVKRAYSAVPSYEVILAAAVKVPLQKFHLECTLQPGVPVSPMLAKPTKSVKEVLKRLNGLDFTVRMNGLCVIFDGTISSGSLFLFSMFLATARVQVRRRASASASAARWNGQSLFSQSARYE